MNENEARPIDALIDNITSYFSSRGVRADEARHNCATRLAATRADASTALTIVAGAEVFAIIARVAREIGSNN
jgi:hypothetical protein